MRGTQAPEFSLATFEELSASATTALLRVSGTTTRWAAEPVLGAERGGRSHSFAPLPGRPRPGRWAYSAPLALVQDPETTWTLELGEETIPLPRPASGAQVERRRGHDRLSRDRGEPDGWDEVANAREVCAHAEARVVELEAELAAAREQIGGLERRTRADAREIEELLRTIRGEAPPRLRAIEPGPGS